MLKDAQARFEIFIVGKKSYLRSDLLYFSSMQPHYKFKTFNTYRLRNPNIHQISPYIYNSYNENLVEISRLNLPTQFKIKNQSFKKMKFLKKPRNSKNLRSKLTRFLRSDIGMGINLRSKLSRIFRSDIGMGIVRLVKTMNDVMPRRVDKQRFDKRFKKRSKKSKRSYKL